MMTKDAVELIYKNETRDDDYLGLFFSKWERVKGNLDLDFTIGKRNDETYIIFESTKPYVDWIVNFLFKPIFGIHRGFWAGYHINEKLIKEKLKEYETQKLCILGHSQGAAYALIATKREIETCYMARKPFDHIEAVVTGGPRVFAIGQIFGQPSIDLVHNGNDIVTKLPPKWLWGYRNVGQVIHIGKPKKWWKISFKDHEISEYLKRMEE